MESINKKFLLNSNFNIYQGHHNIKIRLYLDLILPTTNFFEETNHYLNCFGSLQLNKFILYPPVNVRSDWKIIKMVGNIFELKLPYLKLNDINLRILEVSPILF